MALIHEITEYLDAIEAGQTAALLKDGSLRNFTPDLDPKEIVKIVGKEQLEELIVEKLFGKTRLGVGEYTTMLQLMKIAHRNTLSPKKSEIQKEQKISIELSGGRKKKQ